MICCFEKQMDELLSLQTVRPYILRVLLEDDLESVAGMFRA